MAIYIFFYLFANKRIPFLLIWLSLSLGHISLSYAHPGIQSAHEAIDVAHMEKSIPLQHRVLLYSDEQSLKTEQIIFSDQIPWRLNQSGKANFGQSSLPLWVHFHLHGVSEFNQQTLLKFDYNHIDRLDVYLVADGKIIQRYNTGDTLPFNSRPFASKVFLFPLNGVQTETLEVYLKAQSQGPLIVPLEITTRIEHDRVEKNESLWNGAYFGILFMMFFYNLFIYMLVRDVTYLYYLFYVVNVFGLQFVLAGFGIQYIWPDSTGLNNSMTMVFTALMPLSAVLFVRKFLDIKSNGKAIEIILGRIYVTVFVALLLAGFLLSYMLTLKLLHTAAMLAILFGFYLGVAYSLRGLRSARIFASAWFVYLVFIGVYLLDIKGVTQPNIVSSNALEIGSLLELALLSLSFGGKINEEKEKRLLAQQNALDAQSELNRRLDGLVQQRTAELEEANKNLKEISEKDPLTQLYNRRYFDELIDREWRRAYREKNNLSVAMVDVDHFKNLNDNYGHQFGDECLKRVAQVIRGELRRPPDIVARYGGEEFIVLMPNTDLEGAEQVAEKIRVSIECLRLNHQDKMVSMTASIGVCSLTPSSRKMGEGFIGEADKNLYQAKTNGRNQVVASRIC